VPGLRLLPDQSPPANTEGDPMNRMTNSLDFQAQALTLRAERQRIIAGNIANVDTPGYVAREMDFASALREATSAVAGAGTMAGTGVTSPAHIPLTLQSAGALALKYSAPAQTNLDSNTVDMDRERASFADNAIKYEATLRFINSNVRTALSSITGQ
jgi:flagellar basal-body rod protein FlgB